MNREVTDAEIASARLVGGQFFTKGAGFWYVRLLEDGRVLYLAPAFDWPSQLVRFDRIRLGIARNGEVKAYYAYWDYPIRDDASADLAWRAVLGWDGNDEPLDGWVDQQRMRG